MLLQTVSISVNRFSHARNPLDYVLANISCLSNSECLGFCNPDGLSQLFNFVIVEEKQMWPCGNKWTWMYSNKTLFNNAKPNKNRWQIQFGQWSNSMLTHVKDDFFKHELARATPSHKSMATPRRCGTQPGTTRSWATGQLYRVTPSSSPEWTHKFAFHEQCGSVPITKILTSTWYR